jgi:peptide/nickel transport system substrate-binding protein
MMVTKPTAEQLRAADKSIAFTPQITNATINIIVNTRKPPFNNLRLRQAVNLAMDRNGILRSVYQGGAHAGSALIPHPWGAWGMTKEQIETVPGYGDPAQNKAEARRLLAAEGYGPEKPFRVTVTTRSTDAHRTPAVWVIGELKAVGVEATLRQIDPAVWSPLLAKRDFELALNATAIAIDDPDATFYENYLCGSERNFSDYCNPALEKRFEEQSLLTDVGARHRVVQEIDFQLQHDVARPYLAYRIDYWARQPYVKNWIPHLSVYNGWRMDHVWLDK